MRSEWAIELIGLRRMVSFMTSLLNNCFLGEHLQERLVIVCWELVLDSVGLSPGSAEL